MDPISIVVMVFLGLLVFTIFQFLVPIFLIGALVYMGAKAIGSLGNKRKESFDDPFRSRRYSYDEYESREEFINPYISNKTISDDEPMDDIPISVTDEDFFKKDHEVLDVQYEEENNDKN